MTAINATAQLDYREREKDRQTDSGAKMMQVMSLPYLLQSLVSANGATCVQPRPKGTVHHYPRHCMTNRPGSNTAMSTENGRTGRLQNQCAVDGGSNAAMYGGAVVKREIKTEEGKQLLDKFT